MKKIAVINQKGGVGKTTTTANLGAALARAGQRILLIDFDPQGHLSLHYGYQTDEESVSAYDVLTDDTPIADALIEVRENVALLPADIHLAAAESELVSVMGREVILREALEPLEDDYDYLLIDCPPSVGVLTVNALAAAEEVLIPLQAQFFALQGFAKLLEKTVTLVHKRINPELTVRGVVLCLHEGATRLAGEVVEEISEFLQAGRGVNVPWANAALFNRPVRRNIKLAEACSFGQTIFDYAPRSNGAIDYLWLASEIFPEADIAIPTWMDPSGKARGQSRPAGAAAQPAAAQPAAAQPAAAKSAAAKSGAADKGRDRGDAGIGGTAENARAGDTEPASGDLPNEAGQPAPSSQTPRLSQPLNEGQSSNAGRSPGKGLSPKAEGESESKEQRQAAPGSIHASSEAQNVTSTSAETGRNAPRPFAEAYSSGASGSQIETPVRVPPRPSRHRSVDYTPPEVVTVRRSIPVIDVSRDSVVESQEQSDASTDAASTDAASTSPAAHASNTQIIDEPSPVRAGPQKPSSADAHTFGTETGETDPQETDSRGTGSQKTGSNGQNHAKVHESTEQVDDLGHAAEYSDVTAEDSLAGHDLAGHNHAGNRLDLGRLDTERHHRTHEEDANESSTPSATNAERPMTR